MGSHYFYTIACATVLFLCTSINASAQSEPITAIEKSTKNETQSDQSDRLSLTRAPWGQGLLDIRNEHVLLLNHIQVGADSPETLRENEIHLLFRGAVSQSIGTYGMPIQSVIDAEVVSTSIAIKFGFTDRIQFGVELPLIYRSDGVFDDTVKSVEKRIAGKIRKERKVLRDYEYDVRGVTVSGNYFNYDQGAGFGKLQLNIKLGVYRDNEGGRALSIELITALPTGSPGFGDSGVDGAIRITGSQRLSDLVLYVGLTGMALGAAEENVKLEPLRCTAFAGAEYQITENWSVVCQMAVDSPGTKDLYGTPGNILYGGIGVKGRIGPFTLEFDFGENSGDVKGGSTDFLGQVIIGIRFGKNNE